MDSACTPDIATVVIEDGTHKASDTRVCMLESAMTTDFVVVVEDDVELDMADVAVEAHLSVPLD